MKRLLVMVLLLCCTVAFAADKAKDLSTRTNTLIRKSENKFFSRNIQEADGLLKQAQ